MGSHKRLLLFSGVMAACGSFADGPSPTPGDARFGASSGSSGSAGSSGGSGSSGSSGSAAGSSGSSGEAGAACSNATPCGGNLVGVWTATSSCLTVSGGLDTLSFGFGCASLPVTGSLHVTGTFTANSDGTFSDNTTTSGNEQFTIPASCLSISSTPVNCAGAASVLSAVYSSANCADAPGGGCNCSAVVQQTGGMGLPSVLPAVSGTYATASDVVMTSAETQYAYCVSGGGATFTPQTTSATVTGTLVFQKTAGSSSSSDSGSGSGSGASGGSSSGSGSGASSGSGSGSGSGASSGSSSGSVTAKGPCDIYSSDPSGTVHCVAAHSTVRALIGAYSGRLYQVRNAGGTTQDIGTLTPGGVADASAQDAFCAGTACVVTTIYDQTGRGNDLQYQGTGSAVGGKDQPASATGESVKVGGNKAYSLFINPGNSYWVGGTGVPTGSQPEGMYMVTSGTHFNAGCCFDYGNSEADRKADGAGAMDALNFSTITAWGTGAGAGPWVTADLEFGLFTEGTSGGKNQNDPTQTSAFVTAVLKNNGTSEFTLRGSDATAGALTTFYKGALPPGWSPMKKQGAIVLGSGGDCCATNNNLSDGTFYEGCLVAGYPADATEAAVQANIVAAKYTK